MKHTESEIFLKPVFHLFLAAIVRFSSLFIVPGGYIASDEDKFYNAGVQLLQTGELDLFWPPVSPVLIAAIGSITSPDIVYIRIGWICFDILNLYLLLCIVREFSPETDISWKKSPVFWTGIAYTFYLPAVSFSLFVTSETTTATFVLLTVLILVRSKQNGPLLSILAGLSAGLAILNRTNLLPILFAVPFGFLFFMDKKEKNIKKTAILFLLTGICIVSGYLIRNRVVTGKWILHTSASYNLYIGNKPNYSEDLNLFYPLATPDQIHDRQFGIKTEDLSDEEMTSRAIHYIKDNPFVFLQRAIGRLARVFVPKTAQLQMVGGEKSVGVFSPVGGILLGVTAIQYLFILVFGTAGALSLRRMNMKFHTIITAMIIGALPLSVIAISKPRHSFTFDPLLMLLAVLCALHFKSEFHFVFQNRKKIFLPIMAFFVWAWCAWLIFCVSARL